MPPPIVPTPARQVARRVLDLAAARPAGLGAGRLVCVDGPGGSGKTTLATALADLAPGSRVVHLDDLYDGWSGLASVAEPLAGLLLPLAEGRWGAYRRYDWHAHAYAETVPVAPGPLLVLEGVGSGHRATAHLASVLVWVWAPPTVRRDRALARDGAEMSRRWSAWTAAEDVHFAADDTAARADLSVDGTAGEPSHAPH